MVSQCLSILTPPSIDRCRGTVTTCSVRAIIALTRKVYRPPFSSQAAWIRVTHFRFLDRRQINFSPLLVICPVLTDRFPSTLHTLASEHYERYLCLASPEMTPVLEPRGVCIYSRWPERLSEVNWPAGDQRLREDKAALWKPDRRSLLSGNGIV